jgi:hypothetical protein
MLLARNHASRSLLCIVRHPLFTASIQPRNFKKQQQHTAKMATYGATDPSAFYNSAMADINNGYGQNFDMEEDEFADALEHQGQYDGSNMEGFNTQLTDSKAASGAYDQTHTPSNFRTYNEVPAPATSYQNAPMFGQTNSVQGAKQGYTPFTRPGHYDPLAEPQETINVNKTSASEKHTAAYHDIFKKSSSNSQSQQTSQGQHSSGCSGSRGASTPPATPPPQATQASETEAEAKVQSEQTLGERPWLGPDDLRDVAKPFLREKRWHDKVAHLHPTVQLPSHRYWIGVLNLGQDPKTASKETHFTWMKGNRLTTVETVRNIYAATTMHEGAFMMGGERPEDHDRMEELDLFNDKVVLFKIVEEGTPASKGRRITEGLVTKPTVFITLDD